MEVRARSFRCLSCTDFLDFGGMYTAKFVSLSPSHTLSTR